MQVSLIAIDLAKSIFQVCGVNQAGKPIFNKAVRRNRLMALLLQYPHAIIAMEACGGSNYWGRELEAQGFTTRLIPPQHVKPFVKGNKNDRNDAFAISEAAVRPNLQFVKPRTQSQTDMTLTHRVRERLVRERTRIKNQLHGILSEYGVAAGKGIVALRGTIQDELETPDSKITPQGKELIEQMLEEWRAIDDSIQAKDKIIKRQSKSDEHTNCLTGIHGIGEMTATASVAFMGDGSAYRNGRHFSANLGLVPREHSSGGKQKLGSITKRGNRYLRRLFVQCAWSVIRYADKRTDRLSRWAVTVIERRGKHKAAIAVANKLARIVWSMVYHGTAYRATC
jgi:transposase